MTLKAQPTGSGIFSNDATTKLLGFDYQKLIALEMCLNAKLNEKIWIECKGDVADKNTSTEVKHHFSAHNLTSNSSDVWKTLKNYVTEINVTKTFTKLILHTTSSIPDNSIFFDWNTLSVTKKKKALLDHCPADTIKPYHEKISQCLSKDLEFILNRFEIISNQPQISEQWKILANHPALMLVPLNFRDNAIQELYGYITKQAIDNPNMWQIDINDFQQDMRHAVSKFTSDKIPFPFVSEDKLISTTQKENLTFIKKMKDINLKEKNLEIAISDYFRAQNTQITLLSSSPVLGVNLERYDEDIANDLDSEKLALSYNLTNDDINTEDADIESRNLYFNCIRKPVFQITGVADVQKYYKDGRIHHVVDEGEFEWKFRSKDI